MKVTINGQKRLGLVQVQEQLRYWKMSLFGLNYGENLTASLQTIINRMIKRKNRKLRNKLISHRRIDDLPVVFVIKNNSQTKLK